MFEATDNTRDEGIDQGVEVGSKRTQETLTAADSIIEAVDMADSEIERLRLHKVPGRAFVCFVTDTARFVQALQKLR
jgi:hypothetical protein